MPIHHFTPATRTTINWAGGTSTEIFIYPPAATFAERNFLFRISTATVEAEESAFTFFKGITRHLMILKGELALTHESKYTKHLKPYEQDTFSGEWNTRSKGKVTDFNLMLGAGTTGSLTHHQLDTGCSKTFSAKTAWFFLYIASGTVVVANKENATAGSLIQLDPGMEATIQARENSDVIEINVLVPPENSL